MQRRQSVVYRNVETVPAAQIKVVLPGTDTVVDLFESDGVTPKANPFIADDSGIYTYRTTEEVVDEIFIYGNVVQRTRGVNLTGLDSGAEDVGTAGYQQIAFTDDKVGSSVIAFPYVSAYQAVNVGGAKVGGSATGLSNAVTASGYQVVDVGGAKAGGSATGLTDDVAATAGTQVVDVGGAKAGGSATGLANDATEYDADVVIDGGASQPILVVGSTAQTYTDLLAQLNGQTTGCVWSISGGNLLCTSDSTGDTSTVAITDDDLFLTLTDFVEIEAATPGEDTVVTTYLAEVSVDGGAAQPISIAGGAAQTYTELLAELNDDTTGATWAISGGNLRCTSATTGASSTIDITDDDLFAALTDFAEIEAAVAGTTQVTYTASVVIDGGASEPISIVGNTAQTYTDLLTQLNADTGGVWALVGGNLRLTTSSTDPDGSVAITDVDLFETLTDFVAISAAVEAAADTFEFDIEVDGGAADTIAVDSDEAVDFTGLLAVINPQLTGATAIMVGGKIRFVSDTVGTSSEIAITDDDLFAALPDFDEVEAAVAGTA